MQQYIDPATILTEARMMYDDCHETYILVEGDSDKIFFNTLLTAQPKIRFRPVKGWERVHNTICLAQQQGYTKILGIIDQDYHNLINDGIVENSQLLFTDYNDIEMMMFNSTSFEKFLHICADESKVKAQENLRIPILIAASHLGALRAISLANQYNFHFEGFECKDFINRNNLVANCTQLVQRIIQRTRSKGTPVSVTPEEIEEKVDSFIQKYSVHNLCNGHDVLDILRIAMTKLYASYSANQYPSDDLFNYLLMGYTAEEFQSSNLYKKLIHWINTNINNT